MLENCVSLQSHVLSLKIVMLRHIVPMLLSKKFVFVKCKPRPPKKFVFVKFKVRPPEKFVQVKCKTPNTRKVCVPNIRALEGNRPPEGEGAGGEGGVTVW